MTELMASCEVSGWPKTNSRRGLTWEIGIVAGAVLVIFGTPFRYHLIWVGPEMGGADTPTRREASTGTDLESDGAVAPTSTLIVIGTITMSRWRSCLAPSSAEERGAQPPHQSPSRSFVRVEDAGHRAPACSRVKRSAAR